MENLRWIAAAALSAYACHLAVHHATPIDLALPLVAVAVTVLAWASYPAVMLAVPLIVVAEIALPGESLRLLAFGAVVSVAVGVAISFKRGIHHRDTEDTEWDGGKQRLLCEPPCPLCLCGEPSPHFHQRAAAFAITLVAILILRWIPFANVLLAREIAILAIALATVAVLGRTPLAVTVAVMTALATPGVPLRTLALPLAVLGVAIVARLFGLPRIALRWPAAVALMFVMLFFPWSGVVARAFPYFLRRAEPALSRTAVMQALAPNRSATYDVPEGARMLVVSGANVARLRRGALLGRLDPGGIAVRVGDAADWGYMRREHFYAAHNPLPRDAAGTIRDYGYASWIDGAGRIPLPRGARRIRVTADGRLPADASLQVEGFE